MTTPKLILCIKWGSLYGPDHVNCLYGMARRNTTGEFRFICFTDDASGLREEIENFPLPELGCDIPPDVPGKWPKQALWASDLFGLQGIALYIDLDSVIVDSLDPYFEHGDPEHVYVARNWVRPLRKSAQTSVFRFRIGDHSYMLDKLRDDPAGVSREYQMEQNYVTKGIRGGVRYWPEPWTRHFRFHCMGAWPLRYLRPPKLPRGARLITFPGKPKPEDAAIGRWSPKHTPESRSHQFRYALAQSRAGNGFIEHLKRFILPCEWVTEHYKP